MRGIAHQAELPPCFAQFASAKLTVQRFVPLDLLKGRALLPLDINASGAIVGTGLHVRSERQTNASARLRLGFDSSAMHLDRFRAEVQIGANFLHRFAPPNELKDFQLAVAQAFQR